MISHQEFSTTPKNEAVEMVSASWLPMLCIEGFMASFAGTAERSFRSIATIAGHVAGRTGAKAAAGSSGRPAAVVVAEATANRVVVAITRHGTVAVVH